MCTIINAEQGSGFSPNYSNILNTKTDVFENVVHVSDTPENSEKEIKLWFSPGELIETVYPTKKVKEEKTIWA